MKINSSFLMTFVVSLFLFTTIVAATPGIPHQFMGDVAINGDPAPDGTVIKAKIDGVTITSKTTIGGVYGQDPASIFYVTDDQNTNSGETITFYVDDVEAATFTFINGHVDRLDLAITKSVPTPPVDDGGNTGGGGGSGGGTVCTPDWECGQWGPCVDDTQVRACSDNNNCNKNTNKPVETQECVTIEVEGPITVCELNSYVCRESDLYKCGNEQTEWEFVKTCVLGCDEAHCIGESNEPVADNDLVGMFFANPIISATGIIIFLLILTGVAYLWKRKSNVKSEVNKTL